MRKKKEEVQEAVRKVGRPRITPSTKRVPLTASVKPETLLKIHKLRGNKKIGRYLDEVFE